MPHPLITFTTDFGPSSPYVAAMKGVILSICPEAILVDITHAIEPQNIQHASIVLDGVCPWFPPGTIHVAVVDPGVGTARKLLCALVLGQIVLAPDNGLVSRLALRQPDPTIIAITRPEFWLPEVSATFHGRDILAPVAARLAQGLPPERLGERLPQWVELERAEVQVGAHKIKGVIESIDSFGNLISNITAAQLEGVPPGEETAVVCDEHETRGIFRTYGDQPEMTLIALVGSSGKLELAIVNESAKIMLGVRVGTPVEVVWG